MCQTKIAQGIIAAMVTPMDENGQINYAELKNQVERQINAGISGVFTLGTNGEGYILSHDEKLKVMETVIKQANHRVPVYVGTGCVSTAETIQLSQQAEELGADALSVITPWFAQASQEDLFKHYQALNDAVHIPILLYNIPARTGNALAPKTVACLADLPHIAGIKDSSGNFDNILQYIELTRNKDFAVISGNDSLILWTLKAGGTGGIAACANVLPEIMVSIYHYYQAGKWEEARKAQDSIRPFRNCFKLGNPNTIVKKATNVMGYPVGMPRAPFNGLTKEAVTTIQNTIDEYYSEYKK
ncbi:4-hydroxy-tetrahydrodipicolinate synthase [Lactobacillus helsingborgensis]|uniref:4-hydroxy-tetrahydrodipicolinate synthase n=1 Tax=Lactobacillus helsingborgensis TaxID=1218494 RepID=UPI002263BC5A|nr:4-hydroxy-tetrahydrodipicolinate synthase [Lactobacillus helsingborgensis]UZX31571.1 4-hydroxy-tetrahydrodipicolinate synthase [Lactobacillus helsingborgensis]